MSHLGHRIILLSAHVELLLLLADSCKHDPWVSCSVKFAPQHKFFKRTLKNSKLRSKESFPTNHQSDNVKRKIVHQVMLQNRGNWKNVFVKARVSDGLHTISWYKYRLKALKSKAIHSFAHRRRQQSRNAIWTLR